MKFQKEEKTQTITIKDCAGNTHTFEDIEGLQYLCERTDVMFTFAEVNLAYEMLTGEAIGELTFEDSRESEIDDAMESMSGLNIEGSEMYTEAERIERKEKILEYYDMDDAHNRESNGSEGSLLLQDETVYVARDTWYRLVR